MPYIFYLCNECSRYHVGSSAHCLQVFSEIAESFLENIGAIFGSLMDTYHGGSMTFEDIIMQTLRQSGVPSIDALLYSIDREPAMVISNLRRRKHKLHDYLEALVTPSDTEPDPEDMDIDDDVAFVMGDFGESIGDDYLGLRAMGLRGVDDVPERLWNVEGRKSKLRTRRLHKAKLLRGLAKSLLGEDLIDVPPRYPGAVPFAPVTNALSQIGLLRPFFERKFSETAVDVSLVEVCMNLFLVCYRILSSRLLMVFDHQDEFLPPKVAARKRKKKLPRLTGKAEQSPKRNRKKVDLDALDGTK